MGHNSPSTKTLLKYGVSPGRFNYLLDIQNYACAICRVLFKDRRVFIDHEHVHGFAKMAGPEKLRHVRGLLCFTCNRYRVAKNSLSTAQAVLEYLQKHKQNRS